MICSLFYSRKRPVRKKRKKKEEKKLAIYEYALVCGSFLTAPSQIFCQEACRLCLAVLTVCVKSVLWQIAFHCVCRKCFLHFLQQLKFRVKVRTGLITTFSVIGFSISCLFFGVRQLFLKYTSNTTPSSLMFHFALETKIAAADK